MFSQTAPVPEAPVLDAYIIDRIRRERERVRERDSRVPLHIEPPRPPAEQIDRRPVAEDVPGRSDRGSIVVDFHL
jgi:hypothetical protein